jgi:hypothetical protein
MAAPSNLDEIYRIISPKDLQGGFELKTIKGQDFGDIQRSTIEKILNVLLGVTSDQAGVSGAFSIDDMVGKLADEVKKADSSSIVQETVRRMIHIYGSSPLPDGYGVFDASSHQASYGVGLHGTDLTPTRVELNEALKTSDDPNVAKLGVILTRSPNVSLNVRNTNEISLFFKAIPTLEFSRAVPFLDIRFLIKRPPLSDGGVIQVPSILKFLEGAVPLTTDPNKRMAEALGNQGANQQAFGTKTDMSLFTSPQMLTNYNSTNESSLRSTDIIDITRPFLSIENAEIEVIASPSWACAFKYLHLHLILHDRSRLAEIADFVRPATYTGTNVQASYGWSHGDKSGNNAYANLINRMNLTETYSIKNASYGFDATGQVKIHLQLAMLGSTELSICKISEDKDYKTTHNELEELREVVGRLAERLGLASDTWKETRVPMIMTAAEKGIKPDLGDAEFKKAFDEVKSQIKGKGANKSAQNTDLATKLIAALDKIYGQDSKSGTVEKLKKTVSAQLQNKYEILNKNPDPFLDYSSTSPFASIVKKVNFGKDTKTRLNQYASLAKIMCVFAGQPLQALGTFQEIQLVFHPFNNYAGQARGRNVGELPVNLEYLKKIMDDFAVKKNNPDFSIGDFLRLINDSIISDPRTEAFGLSTLYEKSAVVPVKLAPGKTPADVSSKMEELLRDSGGGAYQTPILELYIETLPRLVDDVQNFPSGIDNGYQILRLHVYDRQSTPYNAFIGLLKAQTSLQESYDMSTKPGSTSANTGVANLVNLINSLSNTGFTKLPQVSLDNSVGVLTDAGVDFAAVKKFISAAMPTLKLGQNNSTLHSVNVSTLNEPLLASANMMRAGGGNAGRPNGTDIGGIPLRVIPGQIEMSALGCPLLTLNQQYFIDLGTGTDMDNIYGLTGISHSIAPGKFDSSLKFIWMDSYGVYESIVDRIGKFKAILQKKLDKT